MCLDETIEKRVEQAIEAFAFLLLEAIDENQNEKGNQH